MFEASTLGRASLTFPLSYTYGIDSLGDAPRVLESSGDGLHPCLTPQAGIDGHDTGMADVQPFLQ